MPDMNDFHAFNSTSGGSGGSGGGGKAVIIIVAIMQIIVGMNGFFNFAHISLTFSNCIFYYEIIISYFRKLFNVLAYSYSDLNQNII